MFLKPAPGIRVLKPGTRVPLAVDGEEVEPIAYWFRRLRDKDVVEAPAPAETAVMAPTASEAAVPASIGSETEHGA